MITRLLLVCILLCAAPVAAQAQGNFLLGLATGGLLFGGNDQFGAGAATIIYSASPEVIQATDPMSVRMVSTRGCFNSEFNLDRSGMSMGELFAGLMERRPEKQRTILQIARVFSGAEAACGSIWFSYIEQ